MAALPRGRAVFQKKKFRSMPNKNVNHPKHYNSHPNGVECIDVIRHYVCDIANALKYLWRAGLKPEMGKDDAEKEIEDLKKALWYIADYRKNYVVDEQAIMVHCITFTLQKWEEVDDLSFPRSLTDHWIEEQIGHTVAEIIQPYEKHVACAIGCLMHVGLINDHRELTPDDYAKWLDNATKAIRQRILDIQSAMVHKDSEDLLAMMQGRLVDGEDYISKPACRRETEPEHYDPLNTVILFGESYCLSDEPRMKDNGAFYSPCDICDLAEVCFEDFHHPEDSSCKRLCELHQANPKEYYRKVGEAKYRPAFGTIEVIDENKEIELELKQQEEDESEEAL